MANVRSIHSVCNSLLSFLSNDYDAATIGGTRLGDEFPCEFRVLSSGDLRAGTDFGTTLSLYLYRVLINEHVRNNPVAHGVMHKPVPLGVDLHFMLSIWTDSAVAEHTICAWVMSKLHQHPIMDVSSLRAEGGWHIDDVVQIIPAELSNEDLMRIWDALAPDYRLSLSYIARVVRIHDDEVPPGQPVVATRFEYEQAMSDDG